MLFLKILVRFYGLIVIVCSLVGYSLAEDVKDDSLEPVIISQPNRPMTAKELAKFLENLGHGHPPEYCSIIHPNGEPSDLKQSARDIAGHVMFDHIKIDDSLQKALLEAERLDLNLVPKEELNLPIENNDSGVDFRFDKGTRVWGDWGESQDKKYVCDVDHFGLEAQCNFSY